MKVRMNSLTFIKENLGINPNGRIQAFFTNTCYKHMDKYVPMSNRRSKTSLRKNVDITPNSITYESPYATYQYRGVREDGTHRVQHYTTAGTGSYWDQRMMSAEKNEVLKEVQREFSRGGQ